MNFKKKISFYNIMHLILITLAFASLILAIIVANNNSSITSTNNMNLSSIAGYLKFLSPNKLHSIISVALHNFGLSLMAYILSLLSGGILGIFPLCSSFFICGMVIYTSPKNLSNIIFVILELVGMCLAVFGGLCFNQKRKKSNWPLEKIFFGSLILITMLFLIYITAACIESKLLQSLWG